MSALASPFKSRAGELAYEAAYANSMKLWPVPYETVEVSSRFGKTHVVTCGPRDGPPLVLLHCFFMSLAVWAYNVAALSRSFRVYAIDMMGQPGKSVPDQPIRNRGEMAEWLSTTLDGLGIGETDLMGWSYGGFAALNYAMHRPDRVRRLILLTPVCFVPLKWEIYLRGLLARLPGRFGARSFMKWMVYGPTLANPETRRFFELTTTQFELGLRHFRLPLLVPPAPFGDEELERMRVPTLLLIGEHESLYDPGAAIARAARLLPDLEADLVVGAGHGLAASHPEAVNERVLAHLSAQELHGTPA
jgi:pimeloyl-ACP methyl ester carboxylesterase